MIGQSHDYKGNGTTTLFAACNVASGEVVGQHYRRRRRIEFLDFMNRVVAQHPGKEIHVIPGQSLDPQAEAGHVAGAAPQRPFPLYADACLLAEPDRGLVFDPGRPVTQGRVLRQLGPN